MSVIGVKACEPEESDSLVDVIVCAGDHEHNVDPYHERVAHVSAHGDRLELDLRGPRMPHRHDPLFGCNGKKTIDSFL